jgi:hypothetical protein
MVFYLLFFYLSSSFCSKEPVFAQIELAAIAENKSVPTINQTVDTPKKPWQTIENAKTIVRDATTKAVDFYHDTGEVVTDLKRRATGTIRSEILYAKKNIVPTVLGIPFYYYEHIILLGCASQCTVSFNIKNILGTIFAVGVTAHFVQWIVGIQQTKPIEGASKKKIEIP